MTTLHYKMEIKGVEWMDKFYVSKLKNFNDFIALLLLTNSDAPLTPIDEIEKTVSSMEYGHILIDQILHSGNSEDRFITLDVKNGRVVRNSISFYTVPKDAYVRNISRNLLFQHNLIDFSILSSIQKRMLKSGISI